MNVWPKTLLLSIAMAHGSGVLADTPREGFANFTPIAASASCNNWDPAAPWVIPEGFRQSLVSDESALNIYPDGVSDWYDMNTVNESGPMAGRYLYRTHEVRCGAVWAVFPLCSRYPGGAVSVVDLQTGVASILVQDPSYQALDGIRWTPWGTLLVVEETEGGRLLEISLDAETLTKGHAIDRPAAGRLAHEGVAVGGDGAVYMVDEHRGLTEKCADGSLPCGGGIYRFVPDKWGDLSSGQLFVLAVAGGEYNTGQGRWLGPIDPANARQAGSKIGGASYQRPEDLQIIGEVLYAAITEGPPGENGKEVFEGRVLAIHLKTLAVSTFIQPGLNAPIEIGQPGDKNFQTGLDNVDNLAATPDGHLVLIEDNKPSDIWLADKDNNGDGRADGLHLFASLTDPGAEGSGIYFGKDPNTLLVNIQHSARQDGDGTWAITRDTGTGDK
ncbi:MAG: DUF839 domain-containing protein [Gammaproteobacteria bacterium]|nr:DUF839 domain-containing protein [Gammaproteobacteria bacterium]MBQ0839246.1 DUF839 domain-containing protein [Gammaproteobacteria bacterium]